MKAVGIDIGNLTTKAVVMENSRILASAIIASGEEAEVIVREAAEQALSQAGLNWGNGLYIVSTGIGGKSISFSQQQKAITTCLARGAAYFFPSARLLIDMGAETSTILRLNERGRVADWVSHDKCAAGTGMFLQQMAKLMQIPLEEMATLSLQAKGSAEMSNTCAVFAESEVISHIHRNPPTPKEDIVAGIYTSVISRIMALVKRVGIQKDVVVSGGVARNIGMVKALEKELGFSVLVAESPQIVAATGAAIIATENMVKG
jgi:predicted CoA-substrate-specific enzyme activase